MANRKVALSLSSAKPGTLRTVAPPPYLPFTPPISQHSNHSPKTGKSELLVAGHSGHASVTARGMVYRTLEWLPERPAVVF